MLKSDILHYCGHGHPSQLLLALVYITCSVHVQ